MKKYEIISDYCKFECEPGVYISVDCVSSGKKELDAKNVRAVERKWREIWPATYEFLKEMRKQNDFDAGFTPEGMRAKLMLADTDMLEDSEWEVSFTIVADGYSEWGIAYNGSTINPDDSQPYF